MAARVLKPPGGGSSDIFGVSAEQPQRKIRSHLTSSIFGDEAVAPARNKAGNDSFFNLFGNEPQVRPESAFKDKLKSHIDLDESNQNSGGYIEKKNSTSGGNIPQSKADSDTNGVESKIVTSCESEVPNTNGSGVAVQDNPVATSDAKVEPPAVNRASSTSSASSSSVPSPSAPTPAAAIGKQRVPPGGFSSGLW